MAKTKHEHNLWTEDVEEHVIMGDYIERAPKSCIAKVMLAEKAFQSWYGGRSVLGNGK